MFKFIAEAYKGSWQRMSGVSMQFGELFIRIGPEEGAQVLVEPSMRKLMLMDHNAAAIYALAIDFTQSKLFKKGLVYLCDDVLIRIGPQKMKDPIIIAPTRVKNTPVIEPG